MVKRYALHGIGALVIVLSLMIFYEAADPRHAISDFPTFSTAEFVTSELANTTSKLQGSMLRLIAAAALIISGTFILCTGLLINTIRDRAS
jgi:hypothetical protein